MKHQWFFVLILVLAAILLTGSNLAVSQSAQPEMGPLAAQIGTAFTYQGFLMNGNSPANGIYDFRFRLYGSSTGTDLLGTVDKGDVAVSQGLFTVSLNFGSGIMNGMQRYLSIGVRMGSSTGSYTTLTPRQLLTAAPYALALPGFYTLPGAETPNLVGGWSGNQVTNLVNGATISGGGAVWAPNLVTDNWGTVSGGVGNRAGNANLNLEDAGFSTVGGGSSNLVMGSDSTIGGGNNNTIASWASTIGGGNTNAITVSTSTIAGGQFNAITGVGDNAIGGGRDNEIDAWGATIAGGSYNAVISDTATIGGGSGNTASGYAATVPGGSGNTASGQYSLAAGYGAQANHTGSFVWADSHADSFASERDYQFRVQAWGGTQFNNGNGDWVEFLWHDIIRTSTGAYLSRGGTWSNASDVALKENFQAVDSGTVLERLARMPVQAWNYKVEDPGIVHLGPTAQDFYAAFGLGETDTSISTVDADGVSMVALQELYRLVKEQETTIQVLEDEKTALEQDIQGLAERVTALERDRRNPVSAAWLVSLSLAGIFGGLVFVSRRRSGSPRRIL